ELLEQEVAVRRVVTEEIVEPGVLRVDRLLALLALVGIAVQNHAVASAGVGPVSGAEHALDRVPERIPLRDRPLWKAVLEVAHDHHAFLERLAVLEGEGGQGGGPAGLL